MGVREELPSEPRAEKVRRLQLLQEKWRRAAGQSFLRYCQHPWLWEEYPDEHHELFVSTLQRIESGELKRVIIIAPPGSAKSTYSSVRFAAWFKGRHPTKHLIAASHTKSLAQDFGSLVRGLFENEYHQAVFPEARLLEGSKAKDNWLLTKGGRYFAVGLDGAVSGRRADGLLIDDPFKGREDADSVVLREKKWQIYKSDLRTRLKANGWICIITTRWHEDDIVGRILPESWQGESGFVLDREKNEEWYVLRIPMESEGEGDPLERPAGQTLWPAYWPPEQVAKEKIAQGTRNWNALYQGVPSTEEGAIIKAAYWRRWPGKEPPICEYIVQSYDTAYEEGEENDYSARTTWGVFDIYQQDNAKAMEAILLQAKERKEEVQRFHAILIEAWRGKVPFHVLKREVKESRLVYDPDRLLIEKKASGISLIQELRRGGVPMRTYSPDKSKTSRAHAAEPAFEQGSVWHMNREWALPVIRECASFPAGLNDDWMDTVTQAINWLRKTYHLALDDEGTDEDDEEEEEETAIYG